jgi:hypothetical protein
LDCAGEKTLGAIATMVLKFLGLGKKSEYFLEAEPASPNGSEPPAKPEAKEKEPAKPKEDVAEAKSTEAEKPEQVKAVVIETVPESSPKAAEAEAPAAEAKSKKAKKVKASSESKTVEAVPEKKTVTPSITKSAPQSTNFATDHLMPSNTPRRRPGPSLDMFKEMARQVKTK